MSSKESSTNFPPHNSRVGIGHMGELATRITRNGTDAVWTNHMPPLAKKLAHGTLVVSDILGMRKEYFGEQPAIATMFQSRSDFGDGDAIYPSKVFDTQENTLSNSVGGTNLRTMDVEADNSFTHPDYRHLPELSEKIVHRMNQFISRAPNLQDSELHQILHKFYLLFSTLHLPTDGSGRLNGDTNTLLQRGLQLALKGKERKFTPQFISHTGYRMSGAEAWAMNEQTIYRSFLIATVMKIMRKNNPLLLFWGVDSDAPASQNVAQADRMLEKYKPVLEGVFTTKPYFTALSSVLSRQIDTIFDINTTAWINTLSKNAMKRKEQARTSPTYYTSRDLNAEHIPILDTLTSLMHYKEFSQVATLLGSPHVVSHKLLRSPVRQRIVKDVFSKLKKHNRELALVALLENKYLQK